MSIAGVKLPTQKEVKTSSDYRSSFQKNGPMVRNAQHSIEFMLLLWLHNQLGVHVGGAGACLHSVDSRRKVLEHSQASGRGRLPLGGAILSVLAGQGSPAKGASDNTGHHAVLPSSCSQDLVDSAQAGLMTNNLP